MKTNGLSDIQFAKLNELLNELTENQMIWLSGYLEGRLSSGVKGTLTENRIIDEPKNHVANLTIIYGTETGNCQVLSEKMAEKALFKNIEVTIYNMYEYDVTNLAKEQNVAVIVSTHGEGELPEMSNDFYEYISNPKTETLENLSFSVLALGDKTYKHFCKAGEDIYNAFKSLGAFNLVPLAKCDLDYELNAEIWMNTFLANVNTSDSEVLCENEIDEPQRDYSRSNPFKAKVLNKVKLSGDQSEKEVFHVELSVDNSGLTYEPGDAVGIFTKNPVLLVNKIIESTDFDPEQRVFIKEGRVTLKDALTNYLEITVLTYDLVNKYFEHTRNTELKKLLDDDVLLDEYLFGRDVLDLFNDYPYEWNANKFVEILRSLPPRLYSISSSQEKVGEQIHATISLVRYERDNRYREGACTSHIANDIKIGDYLPIYIDKNPSFKLPEDNAAIIMVGTGTGIAPYRGFMQQRESQGYKGYSWLFFGDRSRDADFLYKEEWEKLMEEECLERMDVAFSRDQKEKIYVQHKLIENQEEIFEWIENGAHFYLCGDIRHMAKDVNKTLLEIIQTQGGVDAGQAEKYVKMLKREKRFQIDVY